MDGARWRDECGAKLQRQTSIFEQFSGAISPASLLSSAGFVLLLKTGASRPLQQVSVDGVARATPSSRENSALSALSVSVLVCGLNDEWLLLLLRRSRWMMRQSWEMRTRMMVMTMKSGLSKNLEGDRNEVVEARLKAGQETSALVKPKASKLH